MKSVCDTHLSELQLIRPDIAKKYYEISAGGNCFVSVDLIYGEGTLARIETPNGAYLIERYGFFRPYISVKEEKTGNRPDSSIGRTVWLPGREESAESSGYWYCH